MPVITSYSIHYTKLYDIAGAYSAGRRADLPASQSFLLHPVEDDVVRENDVGQFTDPELGVVFQVVAGLELVDLRKKHFRVDDYSVRDHALFPRVQDPGRDQVKNVLFPPDYKRVAGVVSPRGTRITSYNVCYTKLLR